MSASYRRLGASLTVAALVLLSGCAAPYPDATRYREEPVSFTGEHVLSVRVAGPSTVTYLVRSTDDITTIDSCLLHARDLPSWRQDRAAGIHCDVEASGGDAVLELEPGDYLLALYCRPDYAERCHLEVTVNVRAR